MIVVTTPYVAGHRVTETKGMVFGLVVRSRGLGGNIMASLRSLGGGEIHEYTSMLEDTRRQALDRLVQNATLAGANAILSMRFDSSELANTMSEIVAYGHATAPLEEMADPLFMHASHAAAQEAYRDANVGSRDIGVAEVHDCFSITELELYEALGFAERGHGIDLVKDGSVMLDGRLPVNTGGGLMAFGHPVGATGVKQALEIFKQQKGLAGGYQIKGRPTWGLAANIGGDDRTAVVTIYRNVT